MATIARTTPSPPLEQHPEPGPLSLPLPPGALPLSAVRGAARNYRLNGRRQPLLTAVDRHGEALQAEIDRKIAEHAAEFVRTLRRLEVLHGYLATSLAQRRWLARWPAGPEVDVRPVTCRLPSGRRAEIPQLLKLLRRLELPILAGGQTHGKRSGRRGAGPAMAALHELGVTATDVGDAWGVSKGNAWHILNGHQPMPEHGRQALEQLLGTRDRAAVVIDAIPKHPRARAPAAAALQALRSAGGSVEDLSELLQVQPGSIRRWLRGTGRPPAGLADALESAVGHEAAAGVLSLIPTESD
jgi:hypothetical protein